MPERLHHTHVTCASLLIGCAPLPLVLKIALPPSYARSESGLVILLAKASGKIPFATHIFVRLGFYLILTIAFVYRYLYEQCSNRLFSLMFESSNGHVVFIRIHYFSVISKIESAKHYKKNLGGKKRRWNMHFVVQDKMDTR